MTRLLSLAAITTTVSLGLLFAACSGSSGVTFPDASTTTDSGQTGLGGDGGATDGGNQCAPCAQQNPDPSSCTTSDPCGCGPFTCADSGTADSCTWGTTNTCGAGKYCSSTNCKTGKCVALPAATTETSTTDPQCGCDGVTYWNATVAAVHGMSIAKKNDECSGNDIVVCSPASPCAAGGSCNLEVKNLQGCMTATTGACWVLPTTCPGGAILAKNARSCGAASCVGECAAIKGNLPWYADACGPIAEPQN